MVSNISAMSGFLAAPPLQNSPPARTGIVLRLCLRGFQHTNLEVRGKEPADRLPSPVRPETATLSILCIHVSRSPELRTGTIAAGGCLGSEDLPVQSKVSSLHVPFANVTFG